MRFPVFLDTNVLYPATLVDTLLRLSEAEIIRPHWSADVLDELQRNLAERIGHERAVSRVGRMEEAFPEATVSGYDGLVGSMENDSKDRHVLAAAAYSGCEVIVTFNVKDFPEVALSPHGVVAVHPDAFLLDQLDLYPLRVAAALRRQSASTARPHLTLLDVLTSLEKCTLPGFAAEVRRRWPEIGSEET